jgi:hypothetical protein
MPEHSDLAEVARSSPRQRAATSRRAGPQGSLALQRETRNSAHVSAIASTSVQSGMECSQGVGYSPSEDL